MSRNVLVVTMSLCLCGGHRLNSGLTKHSCGIFVGDVLSILAMILLIQIQFDCLSPHSVSRCTSVSLLLHSPHIAVDILMRCSFSFVEIMSCITLYHSAISASDVGVCVRFSQISLQSAFGHLDSTRILCGGDSAMDRALNVTYMRLLYVLAVSVSPCPGM